MFIVSLLATLSSLSFAQNSISLHIIPPPKPIDWTSPKKLLRSVISNYTSNPDGIKKHGIGHAFIELNCGQEQRFFGMTSVDGKEEIRSLRSGYGMGIMFKTQKGRLERSDDLKKDLASTRESGRSSTLKYLISDDACKRLDEYVFEYRKRKYDQTYGGINSQPRRGQGAGCIAFAMSFLDITGLIFNEQNEKWQTTVHVAKRDFGMPKKNKKVKISFLWGNELSNEWAKKHEDSVTANFYNPDLVNQWIRNVADRKINPEMPYSLTIEHDQNSPVIVLDARTQALPEINFFDEEPESTLNFIED